MSEFSIEKNKYGSYFVPRRSSHRPAAVAVINQMVYEPDTIEFMVRHGNHGDIVHAGTYFGDFLPALSHGCPRQTIHAFEPNKENYAAALNTIDINGLTNVVLSHAALTETSVGTSLIKTKAKGKSLGGCSTIVDSDLGSDTDTVTNKAIDDIVFDRGCSIIQLDVEGHEISALFGAIDTITTYSPILILEENPSRSFDRNMWFQETIIPMGYKRQNKLHGNVVYAVTL